MLHHHSMGSNSQNEFATSYREPTPLSSNYSNNNNNNTFGDNDLQSREKFEYEEITLERGPTGLGFTVAGGLDDPHYANDYSIYITRFIPNGPAALDGRLRLEDIIVRVDDIDLRDVKHSEAVSALKNSGNRVQLLIKRKTGPVAAIGNNNYNSSSNITKSYSSASGKLHKSTSNTNTTNNNKNATNTSVSSPTSNQPRFFTSQVNSSSNQLPPLAKGSLSSATLLLRGSQQYSTTREPSSSGQIRDLSGRLRPASSSQSLQQQQQQQNNDEADGAPQTNNNNHLSKENTARDSFSKSASAIDFGSTRGLSRLPRKVLLQRTSQGLGFNIVGGVAGGGTFISYIVPGGVAERSNKLHCGDQILNVNDIDLRNASHEEAATSLKQAGQMVKLVVKYRPEEYIKFENKINDLRERNMLSTGTLQTSKKRSLYARALFDYDPSKDSGLPSRGLPFNFGDILHIINASDDEWWQARKVLDNGQDDLIHLGIIPSKRRVEKRERARQRSVKFINRNNSESTLDRRRKMFSFSKKFPFMKSRENVASGDDDEYELSGSQTNSRGILSTSSTTSINNHNNNNSERGSISKFDNDDDILSYEPVLQRDITYARPIALYGPTKDEIDAFRDDLSADDRFHRMESIVPYTTRPPKEGEVDGIRYHFISIQEMKRDLARHKFVEAGELNNNYYGTSIDSIREVAESGKHVLLNISPKAIKRLYDANLYPITIFIKPKSINSLLEINKRWQLQDAVAAMDQANRLEQDYKAYFTTTVHLDTPNEVLREIYNVIAQHSGPRIWIPTTFEALHVAS